MAGGQRKVLAALAWWKGRGIDQPSRAQIAAIEGYRPSSGNFNNLLGQLRTAGHIDYPQGGKVALTSDAWRGLDKHTGTAADALCSNITPRQADIIRELLKFSGPRSREQIAGAIGLEPTSGNFNNLLGFLRNGVEAIDYPERGMVELKDWVRQ